MSMEERIRFEQIECIEQLRPLVGLYTHILEKLDNINTEAYGDDYLDILSTAQSGYYKHASVENMDFNPIETRDIRMEARSLFASLDRLLCELYEKDKLLFIMSLCGGGIIKTIGDMMITTGNGARQNILHSKLMELRAMEGDFNRVNDFKTPYDKVIEYGPSRVINGNTFDNKLFTSVDCFLEDTLNDVVYYRYTSSPPSFHIRDGRNDESVFATTMAMVRLLMNELFFSEVSDGSGGYRFIGEDLRSKYSCTSVVDIFRGYEVTDEETCHLCIAEVANTIQPYFERISTSRESVFDKHMYYIMKKTINKVNRDIEASECDVPDFNILDPESASYHGFALTFFFLESIFEDVASKLIPKSLDEFLLSVVDILTTNHKFSMAINSSRSELPAAVREFLVMPHSMYDLSETDAMMIDELIVYTIGLFLESMICDLNVTVRDMIGYPTRLTLLIEKLYILM